MLAFLTIVAVVILVCTFSASNALTHDSKLVNSAVLVGDPISMICESASPNNKIWWKFRNSKVTGEKTLYNGSHTYGEGFSVINTSEKKLILTKKAAKVDDSGIYSCITKTDSKSTIAYTAELIVFDPVCNSSIANSSVVREGTIIELWCEIVFFEIVVNSSVVTWFRGDDERVPFENIIKANDALRSNATLQMTAKDEGLIVSFMLHFGQPHTNSSQQQSIVRATNAPEFKFRWSFHAKVFYGPRNISIENLKTSYEYGDTLVCHAEGNTLTYGWNSTATGEVKQGEKFTIPKELTAGISHPYVCVVVNKLLGTTAYKAINITVNDAGSTQTTLLLSVLLPLLAFLFILMLVIVIQKQIIRRESVKVNTEDEQSSGDPAAAFSLAPKLDVRLSSSGTHAPDDNVAEEEETEEVIIQRENTPPYTGLTGVRPISIAPIYAQLGSDDEPPNDIYVNSGDIRFTGSLHEA